MTPPPDSAEALFERQFFQLASECTVEAWLSILGHRWNALILYHLSLQPRRFGDLQGCLPTITAKVLTDRLAELNRRGLIDRDDDAGYPRYSLSASGSALMPILHALEVWARDAPLARPH